MKRKFFLSPAQQKALEQIKTEGIIPFRRLPKRQVQVFEALLSKGQIEWDSKRRNYVFTGEVPVKVVKESNRPKGEYSNTSREQVIDKYLKQE